MKASKKSNKEFNSTLLSEEDLYLFNEGSHFRLYEKLGAHPLKLPGKIGTYFAVWAPNAKKVSVIGDFNSWNNKSHPLRSRGDSGVWEGVVMGIAHDEIYNYQL